MWRIEQKHRYSIMWQKNIDTSSRDRQVHNKNPEYIVTQHKLQSRPNTKWPDTKSSDDAYVARTAHGAGKTQMNVRNFVRVTIKKCQILSSASFFSSLGKLFWHNCHESNRTRCPAHCTHPPQPCIDVNKKPLMYATANARKPHRTVGKTTNNT